MNTNYGENVGKSGGTRTQISIIQSYIIIVVSQWLWMNLLTLLLLFTIRARGYTNNTAAEPISTNLIDNV